MANVIVRTGDPVDQVQRRLRSLKLTVVIANCLLTAFAAYIVWVGGYVGLILVVAVTSAVAIWTWVDNAVRRRRLRMLMRSGRFALPVKNAAPIAGAIDAWLLLRRGLAAVAIDEALGALWFFRSANEAYRLDLANVRRVERGTRRTWYGKVVNIVRLSDQYAGSSIDFDVREGDIDGFVRAAKERAAG